MPERPLVLSAPAPRTLPLIFAPDALARLRSTYEVVEVDPDAIVGLAPGLLEAARYVVGQPPLDEAMLVRMTALRCVFNVEGNFLPNMAYEAALSRGMHVVTTAAVFAEPVAELGLCLALCLARDVVEADVAFRKGREHWGLEGNAGARLHPSSRPPASWSRGAATRSPARPLPRPSARGAQPARRLDRPPRTGPAARARETVDRNRSRPWCAVSGDEGRHLKGDLPVGSEPLSPRVAAR